MAFVRNRRCRDYQRSGKRAGVMNDPVQVGKAHAVRLSRPHAQAADAPYRAVPNVSQLVVRGSVDPQVAMGMNPLDFPCVNIPCGGIPGGGIPGGEREEVVADRAAQARGRKVPTVVVDVLLSRSAGNAAAIGRPNMQTKLEAISRGQNDLCETILVGVAPLGGPR